MHFASLLLATTLALVENAITAPVDSVSHPTNSQVANPAYGPQPGGASVYNDDTSRRPPFPGNYKKPVLPTAKGSPGPDDRLFQNLLSAEWIIFSFYQQGVEAFNSSSFTDLGFPNTTYQRITEIRDNEAGHLRIFQDSISPNSIKPGACNYTFPFHDAKSFLALQTYIEVSSMVFLTGLVQQAKLDASKGALMAIGQTETRHEVFGLIDIWNTDPFSGPSDTSFPHADAILSLTNAFVVEGSCPSANPVYPSPKVLLAPLGFSNKTKPAPGKSIEFTFPDKKAVPKFQHGKDYYAVFFHGVANHTAPFDVKTSTAVVPKDIEADRGVIIAVLADKAGAPTYGSIVAGPLIILAQPAELTEIFA